MKPHRNIRYIEPEEDSQSEAIDKEVELTLNSTHEENFRRFMNHQAVLFALQGIDIYNLKVKKNIYFIEDEK